MEDHHGKISDPSFLLVERSTQHTKHINSGMKTNFLVLRDADNNTINIYYKNISLLTFLKTTLDRIYGDES